DFLLPFDRRNVLQRSMCANDVPLIVANRYSDRAHPYALALRRIDLHLFIEGLALPNAGVEARAHRLAPPGRIEREGIFERGGRVTRELAVNFRHFVRPDHGIVG